MEFCLWYVHANLNQFECIDRVYTDVYNHVLDESLTIPWDTNFHDENDIWNSRKLDFMDNNVANVFKEEWENIFWEHTRPFQYKHWEEFD